MSLRVERPIDLFTAQLHQLLRQARQHLRGARLELLDNVGVFVGQVVGLDVLEEQPCQVGVGGAKVGVQLQGDLEFAEGTQGLSGPHLQLTEMVMAHSGQRVQSQAATESGDGSLRVAGVGPLGVEPAEGETDTIGAGSERRVAFFGVEDVLEVVDG